MWSAQAVTNFPTVDLIFFGRYIPLWKVHSPSLLGGSSCNGCDNAFVGTACNGILGTPAVDWTHRLRGAEDALQIFWGSSGGFARKASQSQPFRQVGAAWNSRFLWPASSPRPTAACGSSFISRHLVFLFGQPDHGLWGRIWMVSTAFVCFMNISHRNKFTSLHEMFLLENQVEGKGFHTTKHPKHPFFLLKMK